jgi:hypothetical protein
VMSSVHLAGVQDTLTSKKPLAVERLT